MNLAPVTKTQDDLDTTEALEALRSNHEEGDEAETTPADSAPRTRPRAVPLPRAADPNVPLSIFGGVPEGVTHWRMRRRMLGGGWEPLVWSEPGAIAAGQVWPLSELKEEIVRARWGAGRYQPQWCKPTGGGGMHVLRGGREVDILPEAPAAPAAPAALAPSTSFGPEVDRTLQMMRMITTEADAKMSSVLQFAAALAGRNNNGFGAAELELIMRNNREATAAAVTAAVAPLQAELATMRAELDQEDEDEPGIVGAAAAAAASTGLLKGKGAWVQAANFAAGNPELVKAALPIVAETFAKIASIFSPKQERPRAQPIAPMPIAPMYEAPRVPPPPPPPPAPNPPPVYATAPTIPTATAEDHGNTLAPAPSSPPPGAPLPP